MAQVEIIKANLKTNEEEIVNNTKKVCAYCRVSTDSDEQINSYNSQIKHYSNKIKSNPNTINFILRVGSSYQYEINDDKTVSFRTTNMGGLSEWTNL